MQQLEKWMNRGELRVTGKTVMGREAEWTQMAKGKKEVNS